jgi:hypothetical protein
MKTILINLTAIIFFTVLASCIGGEKSFTAKFDGAVPGYKWALKDINPDLPSDWSTHEYLTFDLRATSTQRFDLWLYDREGERRIRIHPFQGAWVRISVPLFRFKSMNTEGTTMSATYQAGLPSCWLNFHHGPFGSINQVDSIGVGITNPIGSPVLEFRNVRLTMAPEDSILSPLPLIDRFGQWIPAEWPGKANSIEELRSAWDEEDRSLRTDNFNFSRFGGFLDARRDATGFFRVEKVDGKSWFVDPEGYLFFSIGSTGIGPGGSYSRLDGREYIFESFPPEVTLQSGRSTGRAAFSIANLSLRYGEDWYEKWMDMAVRRMDDWGFNTIANWSDATLGRSQRKPYVMNIGGWGTSPRTMGMPDVYDPGYASLVNESAQRQCAPLKDDPYLIGYFIGNEPIWPGREQELVEVILAGDATPMQSALKKYLAAGDTPSRRSAFVYETYEKFISMVDAAMKRHDPNHLNLGLRFGGSASKEIIEASSNYFDVFSINIYGFSVNMDIIQRIYDISGLPIVIGEFHFGVPGKGLAPGLVQTKNQEERGVAYRYYVENAAAHPAVVGTHWFQWMDQPSSGRGDGENYNIGLVDVTDRPYVELIDAARETHGRLFGVHSGRVPPVTRMALTH